MFQKIYQTLYKELGPQKWWPGETPFEVVIGAILTQNTSWSNVEKSIKNLKKENLLTPDKLWEVEDEKLEELIRSSGYYRQKTKKIKNFLRFLQENYNGELMDLFKEGMEDLRRKLISVNGIGKETADSIILYAANKPIFVIDAYTRRIFNRLGVTQEEDYDELQKLFQKNLPQDSRMFNEYHALIVHLGKNYCKKNPNCRECPLKTKCEYGMKKRDLSG